jgi:hypothetical protein
MFEFVRAMKTSDDFGNATGTHRRFVAFVVEVGVRPSTGNQVEAAGPCRLKLQRGS